MINEAIASDGESPALPARPRTRPSAVASGTSLSFTEASGGVSASRLARGHGASTTVGCERHETTYCLRATRWKTRLNCR